MNLSLHNHNEGPLTGSTLNNFILKSKELGRTHFVSTEFSYFSNALKVYDLAPKNEMKPIIGVEVFFLDSDCPIFKSSKASKARYYKTTLYCTDQKQFQTLGILISKNNNPIHFMGEEHPTFNWNMLKVAADVGCLIGNADVHDIISKHIVMGDNKAAEQVLLKLKDLFKENLYLTLIGVKQDRKFVQFAEIILEDGTKLLIPTTERVQTNAARNASVFDVVDNTNKHFKLISTFIGKIVRHYDQKITSAKIKEGYLKLKEGDIQLNANKGILELSKKYDIPLLYSDYSAYVATDDKQVQDVRLSSDNRREYVNRHMQSSHEMTQYLVDLGLNELEIDQIRINQDTWATRFNDFKLNYEYRLPTPEGDVMKIIGQTIRDIGRFDMGNTEAVDRLEYEINTLSNNGKVDLLPYFLPLIDITRFCKENGILTGPSRGSAGGSYLCYLLGITHINPLEHELSFDRFLSLDRILNGTFPDIDMDFSSRDKLVGEDGVSGYLFQKYGDKIAPTSTKSLLKLKSSIKDTNRYFHGKVEPYIEALCKKLPSAPEGLTDERFIFGYEDEDGKHVGLIEDNEDLKTYVASKPKEWAVVRKCLGISRSHRFTQVPIIFPIDLYI